MSNLLRCGASSDHQPQAQRKYEVGAICSVTAEYFEMRTFGVPLQVQGMGSGLLVCL